MGPVESLPAIRRHFKLDSANVRFLGCSQNAVYEFADESGVPRILRITAGSHRSRPEIEAELAWVQYLHDGGLSVCPPLPHGDGTNLIISEQTAEGDFHGVVFEKAAGNPLLRPMLGAELYHDHGRLLGAMHAASKDFPRDRLAARTPWDEERYFTTDIDLVLPEDVRQPVRTVFTEIRSALGALEITRDSVGPVHLDLGYANLHRHDNGRLQAFDFDNCSIGPFLFDIAAALYGSIFCGLRCGFAGDRGAFDRPRSGENLEQVWRPFMDGYGSQNNLPPMPGGLMRTCFDALYLRSVVHAWRVQLPITTPARRQALDSDVEHLLRRTLPLNFDFSAGKATG